MKNKGKNSPLKLLMLTDGNTDQASARIRAIEYIPMLAEAGYSVCWIPRVPVRRSGFLMKNICFPVVKRLLSVKRLLYICFRHWDVVYIQRLCLSGTTVKRLAKKSRVIYDFDDAIYLGKANKSAEKRVANMVKHAHQVVVSTPWLEDFCHRFNHRTAVIPTPVDVVRFEPKKHKVSDQITIGWVGSRWTTKYLKIVEPALQQLSRVKDFRFLTIGAESGYSLQGVNHTDVRWEMGIEPKVLPAIDIGIMPLPDEDYAKAKGGYKLYLYMAAAIPCVASPVGINSLIVEEGTNGFLAGSVDDWVRVLSLLIDDSELRNRLGQNGRKQAVELYDRPVCFSQLIKTFNKDILNE